MVNIPSPNAGSVTATFKKLSSWYFLTLQIKEFLPISNNSVQGNKKETREENPYLQLKILPAFLSHYQKQTFPEKVDNAIVDVLENHIEGMEPQFRSASFAHLWHALKQPLTCAFRPRSLEESLHELKECLSPHNFSRKKFGLQINQETVKKPLIVCMIHKMLSHGHHSDKSETIRNMSFNLLWQLMSRPLTELLNTGNVSILMQEIKRYSSRFELAGISYNYPTKMSEVMRDVLICKLDDILNEVFLQFMNGD